MFIVIDCQRVPFRKKENFLLTISLQLVRDYFRMLRHSMEWLPPAIEREKNVLMNEIEIALDVSKAAEEISFSCLPAKVEEQVEGLASCDVWSNLKFILFPTISSLNWRLKSFSRTNLRPFLVLPTSDSLFKHSICSLVLPGSSRYPYHENSSSDSEEEILRRLKLQQSISLQSGQIAKYGGFSQSINVDGFQPVPTTDISTKPIKHSSSRTSSLYNNGHRYSNNSNHRDLLGQAERGKIGSHSSSECSSNSSVEASVESNTGLINHEKKGERIWCRPSRKFTHIAVLVLDRRQVNPILDRVMPLRDSRIERRGSGSKLRSSIAHQDSLEDVPDINSLNQDVSRLKSSLLPFPHVFHLSVHRRRHA